MAELIHEYEARVRDADGAEYRVRAYTERGTDGRWSAWLDFVPLRVSGHGRRTSTETVQAEREDVVYWASGLEPIYLDGAFARARTRR